MHALDVRDRGGLIHRLVLRRFVRADWRAEEPDAPTREAAALDLVRRCPLATPRLVALDPDGTDLGEPAVLMARLRGRIDWDPPDLEAFLRRLAAALPRIHSTPLPPDPGIPAYGPYELGLSDAPPGSDRPDVWRRAIEVFNGPAPSAEDLFIHRDYHPGNVLWSRGDVSGVVDWVHASVGSPYVDVGHCRGNLADRFGLEAADRFLDLYRAESGRGDYDPYWDIVAALGGRSEDDYLHGPSPEEEPFLTHALSMS
jgi:aminoglycoside phosphotransferase (APT) family kinase protein